MIDPAGHKMLMEKIYALLPAELTDGDYPTGELIHDLVSVDPFVAVLIPLVIVVQNGKPIGRRRKDGSISMFPLPITFDEEPDWE